MSCRQVGECQLITITTSQDLRCVPGSHKNWVVQAEDVHYIIYLDFGHQDYTTSFVNLNKYALRHSYSTEYISPTNTAQGLRTPTNSKRRRIHQQVISAIRRPKLPKCPQRTSPHHIRSSRDFRPLNYSPPPKCIRNRMSPRTAQ